MADLAATVWQFNEAVSLLREARHMLPNDSTLAEEIDEELPNITEALRRAALGLTTTI